MADDQDVEAGKTLKKEVVIELTFTLDELHARAAQDIETITGLSIEAVLEGVIEPQLGGEPDQVPSQVDRLLYNLREILVSGAGDIEEMDLEELARRLSRRRGGTSLSGSDRE